MTSASPTATRRTMLALGAGAALSSAVARAAEPNAAGELRIGIQYGISYLPFFVAERQGLWEAHAKRAGVPGLKVSAPQFGGSTALNDALLSGQLDGCVTGTSAAILIWDRTIGNRRAVAGWMGLSNSPGVLQAVEPRLRSIADLSPADRIAMPSIVGNPAYMLRIQSERVFGEGQSKHLDANMVALPHPDAMNALLSGTEVTAHFASPPFTQLEARDRKVHRILDSKTVFGGTSSWVIIAGSLAYAEANPAAMDTLYGALGEAFAFIRNEPAKAAAVYLEAEPSRLLDAGAVEQILRDPENAFSAEVYGLMTYAAFMARTGALRHTPAGWQDVMIARARTLAST